MAGPAHIHLVTSTRVGLGLLAGRVRGECQGYRVSESAWVSYDYDYDYDYD